MAGIKWLAKSIEVQIVNQQTVVIELLLFECFKSIQKITIIFSECKQRV